MEHIGATLNKVTNGESVRRLPEQE